MSNTIVNHKPRIPHFNFRPRLPALQGLLERDLAYHSGLLLIMLLVFGLQAMRLGFYWDDWQMVYLTQTGDPATYWRHWLYDRPFVSWIYLVTTSVVQNTPVRSHFLTLFIRWLGILGCYLALKQAWPQHRWQVRWIGLLLVVFPGFIQQSVSLTYGAHFTTFGFFSGSMALMVAAIKDQRRFWIFMPLAWFLAILQIFSMEYFVGLELLRPLLVWQLTRTQAGSLRLSLAKVMKIWFPYLLFLVMFAIWRVLIFPSITDPASLSVPTILVMMKANPLNGLIELVEVAVRDLLYLASGVWLEPLSPDSVVLRSSAYLASLALGLLAALIAFILPGIRDTEPPPAFQEGSGRSFLQLAMPFSLLALIGGGLPVWLTGRVITEGAWSDRFALGPMIGSVVFLVCLVEWLGGPKVLRKAILLSFLVGIASAYQFQIARNFRTHWDLQRDYYWQLGWRAPALQHGTAVVMPSLPFSYVAEYSMGFALNTLYGPGFSGDLATVWFINGFRAQGSRQLPALEPGYPIEDSFRNVVFRGDTSNTIVIAYNKARGCLRVLDGVYQLAPPIEKEDLLLKIANTDLILPGSDTPTPARIFGPEPDHTWCYYFQKADLARQTGDWVEALQLAEQVESLNLSPVNPVEWLPFIEAYAHAGRWQDSHQWINLAVSQKPDLIPFYCDAWSRLQQEAPPSEQQLPEVEALKQSLNCPLTRE